MTGIPDEYVEKAARVADEHWITNHNGPRCVHCGWWKPFDGEDVSRAARRHVAEVALAGLPALLERVEAAERANPILADAMDYYAERRPMNNPKGWEHVLRVVARGVENAVWPTSTEEQRRQAINVINSLVVAEQAQRDALAAKVARVEALADEWERSAKNTWDLLEAGTSREALREAAENRDRSIAVHTALEGATDNG